VESDSTCANFDLRTAVGTYDGSSGTKTYVGPFADSLEAAKKLEIYGYKDGEAYSWSVGTEETAFGRDGVTPDRTNIVFDSLECGRMYMIKNFGLIPLNIPGFVPSASGVDMGRVVPV
jgi:hypothetical protein